MDSIFSSSNSDKSRNQVLVQAWQDYDPQWVRIHEAKLAQLHFTDEHRKILMQDTNPFFDPFSLKEMVFFTLGLNSINYQFWEKKGGTFQRYQNKGHIGALGMVAGFQSLYHDLKSRHFDTALIDESLLHAHFSDIPEIKERVMILKESLDQNRFELVWNRLENHLLNHACFDVSLAQTITSILPLSFEDPYLKKIQLALYDIAHFYLSRGEVVTCDITVAADYQIPKVLEGLGILEYAPELSHTIDQQELIDPDSPQEKAIRAATIIASDEISRIHSISIPALDRMLWLSRNDFKDKSFHLTRTRYY